MKEIRRECHTEQCRRRMPGKMIRAIFEVLIISTFALGGWWHTLSTLGIADNRDGIYTNPIIFADYSDPDVIRVGNDFYMTASSFNCSPGLPILHSRDLVNWTIVGHALQRLVPEQVFDKPQLGKGVWVPAIRHHNGEFYIYYPDPDFGIYVVKARNAAGPWSRPVLIKSAKGWIDPCPFWDDDGSAYLVFAWAKSRAGINSILTISRMTSDGMKVIDEGKTVFDGHANHPTIEGPKLYKRNGYYYIFAPREASLRAGRPCFVPETSTDRMKIGSSWIRATPGSTVHTRARGSS
jgi:beta-xylosidase